MEGFLSWYRGIDYLRAAAKSVWASESILALKEEQPAHLPPKTALNLYHL
jgi:hypothetical protein